MEEAKGKEGRLVLPWLLTGFDLLLDDFVS